MKSSFGSSQADSEAGAGSRPWPFPVDTFICFYVCLLMTDRITDTLMQDPKGDLSFPVCASRREEDPDSDS